MQLFNRFPKPNKALTAEKVTPEWGGVVTLET